MKKIVCLAVLLLAGCATPEQRAANIIANFSPMCEALGYQRNTDPWRACIVDRSNNAQAMGLQGIGAFQRSQPAIVQPQQVPMPTRTQCLSGQNGSINCTSQ